MLERIKTSRPQQADTFFRMLLKINSNLVY